MVGTEFKRKVFRFNHCCWIVLFWPLMFYFFFVCVQKCSSFVPLQQSNTIVVNQYNEPQILPPPPKKNKQKKQKKPPKNILAPLLSHGLGTFGVSLLCETLLAVHTSLLASKSFTTSILATIIVQILNECKTEDNPGGNSGALCQSLTHIFKQFLN